MSTNQNGDATMLNSRYHFGYGTGELAMAVGFDTLAELQAFVRAYGEGRGMLRAIVDMQVNPSDPGDETPAKYTTNADGTMHVTGDNVPGCLRDVGCEHVEIKSEPPEDAERAAEFDFFKKTNH
jgi:hypothetical protein